MFPESIHFSVRPNRLLQSVDELPELKGRLRKQNTKVQDIRSKLLQLSIEQLSKLPKMKDSMVENLPYLAAEVHNKDLRARVLVISQTAIPTMSIPTLSRLLPFLYTERAFVEAVNARFVRKAPDSGPRWMTEYWKEFRQPSPSEAISKRLLKQNVSISEIQSHLDMCSSNLLFQHIVEDYVRNMKMSCLREENFQLLMTCCNGGFPLSAKRALLTWLLEEYMPENLSLKSMSEGSALREVVCIALKWIPRIRWGKMRKGIATALKVVWVEEQLKQLLGQSDSMRRVHWWRRWIRAIDDIHYHRPSGKIFLFCQGLVCVESIAVPLWMNVYPKEELIKNIQPKLWQPMPFNITISSIEKQRIPGWQLQFDDWMRQHCKGRPEKW